jgi:hypothetical protein
VLALLLVLALSAFALDATLRGRELLRQRSAAERGREMASAVSAFLTEEFLQLVGSGPDALELAETLDDAVIDLEERHPMPRRRGNTARSLRLEGFTSSSAQNNVKSTSKGE